MPKTSKETSNHPCHFLSLPSAKRFWCRHCMSVFEDAITRWRHSRSCRYGVVNNFMRRRQLEAKALQNTTKPNPIEARLEHSVSPSEEPIISEEGQGSSSGEKSNQATSNDLFRCFICHNRFSTLEEMRHHVKYPCNNKKIITDVPNPAMTVYIDEFTDRSRQWDPQPQQEEVISSELIPNIVSQETVHTVDVKTEIPRENVASLSENNQKLTPTNIYVNEQGETVIEVENLDLNSEGGELSLAHLLTQLSQQGIVFDKTKASQMQAQHETTVSDPASGEIYATGTSFEVSSSTQTVMKEDDEGQPTAEEAANTLAQLAVFRGGYRTNPETYEGTHMSTDLQREYVVEVPNESYTYSESYAIPSTTSGDQLTIGNTESHANFKVEYDYNYLPSNQPAIVTTTPQLPLQSSILESATSHLNSMGVGKEFNNIQSVPTLQVQQHDGQPQVVTYISSSTAQQTQTPDIQEETLLIEDYVVEDPSSTVPPQQYHVNISDGIRRNESQQASIPAILDTNHHNSYIVFSTDDNSTQIICNPQNSQNELNVNPNCVSDSILNNEVIPNNHQQQHHYIPTSNDAREGMNEEMKDTEEFEVQTVTLQEIVEEETADAVSFGETPSSLCTQPVGNIDINAANSSSDLQSSNQLNDQCIQLDILQQTAHDIVHNDGSFTVAVEHQQSQEVSVSESSPMPVYVMSPHGRLQLLATPQERTQTQPPELLVPSNSSHSQE